MIELDRIDWGKLKDRPLHEVLDRSRNGDDRKIIDHRQIETGLQLADILYEMQSGHEDLIEKINNIKLLSDCLSMATMRQGRERSKIMALVRRRIFCIRDERWLEHYVVATEQMDNATIKSRRFRRVIDGWNKD